jgi:hypothetical protein
MVWIAREAALELGKLLHFRLGQGLSTPGMLFENELQRSKPVSVFIEEEWLERQQLGLLQVVEILMPALAGS